MKKIKILRIIARLNIGGPAIHTVLLTEGLSKDRFDSLLVCGNIEDSEGDMSYYAAEKNVFPVFIRQLERSINPLNDLRALVKIYQIIKTENPDIVHTHTAKAGSLGRAAAIIYNLSHPKNKIKLVHTFHGHVFSGYFNRFNTRFFVLIERFLAAFTDCVITVSESVKKEILSLKICPAEKINVIPLGFELKKFLAITPRSKDHLNIGIVGRLVPIKNHKLFLEAASDVIKNNPHIKLKFQIVGDGSLKEYLEDYSRKLSITGQVDFLGWQKDLAHVYSDLDIVALTSINEGTPVSLIEAMASGRVVVATDVGGVRDLLGPELKLSVPGAAFRIMERGILVNSQEHSHFAAALQFALDNDDLRIKMGASARDFTRISFSKNRLIKDIESIYNRIFICT